MATGEHMELAARFCASCGMFLGWIGSRRGPSFCCEGCGRGKCACGGDRPLALEAAEERLRDAYRIK